MPIHVHPGFHPGQANLWAPPLPFRRDPPQINWPSPTVIQCLALDLVSGIEVAGVPLAAPLCPETELHSLPATLCTPIPKTMGKPSKAPRGLFVPPPVPRVFTGIAFSPGSSPRQSSSRYAFHALRNLPGKELRSFFCYFHPF
jgi:hypothetical protein